MTKNINALIIDDEKNSRETLKGLLKKYCQNILICGEAASVEEGVNKIKKLNPDIVFLDITMPDGKGFEVLERLQEIDFEVVFTTSHDDYAIKAFEFSAIHYLLKPIKYKELQEAVKRFEKVKEEIETEQLKVLTDNLNNNKPEKIILPSSDGLSIIEIDRIIRCESYNNYTTFYLNDKEKILVSKPINNYQTILEDLNFVRIHSKHIVNLCYIKKYVKGRGGYVILLDGTNVDVSEGKKKDFLSRLNEYARS